VINHVFKRGGRVVVEVWGGPTDSAELGDVHYPEIRGLAGEK